MPVKLTSFSLSEIKVKLKEVEALEKSDSYKNIDEESINNIFNILGNNDFKRLCDGIKNADYYNNMSYNDLASLHELLNSISKSIGKVKERYDVNMFLKGGYVLNSKELKKEYQGKAKINHPNLNIDRLCELYKYPPEKLKVYHCDDEINIDSFVFRKYIIGMIQMIYNEMDLVCTFVGGEGSGKSTKVTQDMFMVHWILTEIGIIDYKFNIKDIFVNSLKKFRELEDQYFHERFRIIGLDEGNELNRNNWRDEEVQTFFQRLRRERHNQRIKFICIPVLGELLPAVVLARVNFIFEMNVRNKVRSGTLRKGYVNFYIIPRESKIYSPHFKRELSQDEIKTALQENLKDKSYLKGVPKNLVIKKFTCNGTWGFKESDYIKNLKETNEMFSISKGITLSETELFMLYKCNPTMKKLEIDYKDPRYHSVSKIFGKVKKYFEKDPDKLIKHEMIYKRKFDKKEDMKEIPVEVKEDTVEDHLARIKKKLQNG